MKNNQSLLFFIALFLTWTSVYGQTNPTQLIAKPIVSGYDFGTILKGTSCVYQFAFSNTVNKVLLITSTKTSSGLTTVTSNPGPILTVEKSNDLVKYGVSHLGVFKKSIPVNFHLGAPINGTIKGYVVLKK